MGLISSKFKVPSYAKASEGKQSSKYKTRNPKPGTRIPKFKTVIIILIIEFFLFTQTSSALIFDTSLSPSVSDNTLSAGHLDDFQFYPSIGVTNYNANSDDLITPFTYQTTTQQDGSEIPDAIEWIDKDYYINLDYTEKEIDQEIAIRKEIAKAIWPDRDISIDSLSPEEDADKLNQQEMKLVEAWASLVEGGLREVSLAQVMKMYWVEVKGENNKFQNIILKNKSLIIAYRLIEKTGELALHFPIKNLFGAFKKDKQLEIDSLHFTIKGLGNKDYSEKELKLYFVGPFSDKRKDIKGLSEDGLSVMIDIKEFSQATLTERLERKIVDWSQIKDIYIHLTGGTKPLEGTLLFENFTFTLAEGKEKDVLPLENIKELINFYYKNEEIKSNLNQFMQKVEGRYFDPIQDRDFLTYLQDMGIDEATQLISGWNNYLSVSEELLNRPLFTRNIDGLGFYWNIKDEALLAESINKIESLVNSGKVDTAKEAIDVIKLQLQQEKQLMENFENDILLRKLDMNLPSDYKLLDFLENLIKEKGVDRASKELATLSEQIYGVDRRSGLLKQSRDAASKVLNNLIQQIDDNKIKGYLEYIRNDVVKSDTKFDLLLKYGGFLLSKDETDITHKMEDILNASITEAIKLNLGKEEFFAKINSQIIKEFFEKYDLDDAEFMKPVERIINEGLYKNAQFDKDYLNIVKQIDGMLTLAIISEIQEKDIREDLNKVTKHTKIKNELIKIGEEYIDYFQEEVRYWRNDYADAILKKVEELKAIFPDSVDLIAQETVGYLLEAYLGRILDLTAATDRWMLDYWAGKIENNQLNISRLLEEFKNRYNRTPLNKKPGYATQEVNPVYYKYPLPFMKNLFNNIVLRPGEQIGYTFLKDMGGGPIDIILDTFYAWRNFRIDVERGLTNEKILALDNMKERPLLDYFGSYLPLSGASNSQIIKFLQDKVRFDQFYQIALGTRTDLAASIKEAGYSSFWAELKQKGFSDDDIKQMLMSLKEINPLLTKLYGEPSFNYKNMPDREFLEEVARKSFDYFLATIDEDTGLFQDALRGVDTSTAVTGFGLTALVIGTELGWIDKGKAEQIILKTLDTFLGDPNDPNSPIAKAIWGLRYHYYQGNTTLRSGNNELSTVDTSLFLLGALTAGEYFKGEIKEKADEIYERINWGVFQNNDQQITGKGSETTITMGWKPEQGFLYFPWDMYSGESLLIYLLALGSPTYPINKESFYTGFGRPKGKTDFGFYMMNDPEGTLFTHQYAHAWFDFLGRKDKEGKDYFNNSILATLNNIYTGVLRSNIFRTYGLNAWGISSMGRPERYTMDFGIEPTYETQDTKILPEHDGTISASGPGGSIVFTPYYAINALRYMRLAVPPAWGEFGFKDSYNLDRNFFSPTYFGLGEGITLLMLANFLYPDAGLPEDETNGRGIIWNVFMENENIKKAMEEAGLKPDEIEVPQQVSGENNEGFNRNYVETTLTEIFGRDNIIDIIDDFDSKIITKAKTEGDFKNIISVLEERIQANQNDTTLLILYAKTRIDEVENIAYAAKTDLAAGRYFLDVNDDYYNEAINYLDKILNSNPQDVNLETIAQTLLFVAHKKQWNYREQKDVFVKLHNLTKGNEGLKDVSANIISKYFEEELISNLYASSVNGLSIEESELKAYFTVSLWDRGIIDEENIVLTEEYREKGAEAYIESQRELIKDLPQKLIQYVKYALDSPQDNPISTIPWLENYLNTPRQIDQFEPSESGRAGYYATLLITQGYTIEEVKGLIKDMTELKPVVNEVRKDLGKPELDLWNNPEDVGLLSFAVKLKRDGYTDEQIKSLLKGESLTVTRDIQAQLEEAIAAKDEKLPSTEEAINIISAQQVENITGFYPNINNDTDTLIWQNLAYLVNKGLDVADIRDLKNQVEDIQGIKFNLRNINDLNTFMNWGKLFANFKAVEPDIVKPDRVWLDRLREIVQPANSNIVINNLEELAQTMKENQIRILRTIQFMEDITRLKPELEIAYGKLDIRDDEHLRTIIDWAKKTFRGYSVKGLIRKIAMFNLLKNDIKDAYSQNLIEFDIFKDQASLKQWAETLDDFIWQDIINNEMIGKIIEILPNIEIVTKDLDNNEAFSLTVQKMLRYRDYTKTEIDLQNRTVADETFKILTALALLQGKYNDTFGFDIDLRLDVGAEVEVGEGSATSPIKALAPNKAEKADVNSLDVQTFINLIDFLEDMGYFDVGHYSRHTYDHELLVDSIKLMGRLFTDILERMPPTIKNNPKLNKIFTGFIIPFYLNNKYDSLKDIHDMISSELEVKTEVKNGLGEYLNIMVNLSNELFNKSITDVSPLELVSLANLALLKQDGVIEDATIHIEEIAQNEVLNEVKGELNINDNLWKNIIIPGLETSLNKNLSLITEAERDEVYSALTSLDLSYWIDLSGKDLANLIEEEFFSAWANYNERLNIMSNVGNNIKLAGENIANFLEVNVLGREFNLEKDSEVFKDWLGSRLPQVMKVWHEFFDWEKVGIINEVISEGEILGRSLNRFNSKDLSLANYLAGLKKQGIIDEPLIHIIDLENYVLGNQDFITIRERIEEKIDMSIEDETWIEIILPQAELLLGKDINIATPDEIEDGIRNVLFTDSLEKGKILKRLNDLTYKNSMQAEVALSIKSWADAVKVSPFALNISKTKDLLEKEELIDVYADYVGRPELKDMSIEEIRDTDMLTFANLSYWRDQIDIENYITIETIKMYLSTSASLIDDALMGLYNRRLNPLLDQDVGKIGYFNNAILGVGLRYQFLGEALMMQWAVAEDTLIDEFFNILTQSLETNSKEELKAFFEGKYKEGLLRDLDFLYADLGESRIDELKGIIQEAWEETLDEIGDPFLAELDILKPESLGKLTEEVKIKFAINLIEREGIREWREGEFIQGLLKPLNQLYIDLEEGRIGDELKVEIQQAWQETLGEIGDLLEEDPTLTELDILDPESLGKLPEEAKIKFAINLIEREEIREWREGEFIQGLLKPLNQLYIDLLVANEIVEAWEETLDEIEYPSLADLEILDPESLGKLPEEAKIKFALNLWEYENIVEWFGKKGLEGIDETLANEAGSKWFEFSKTLYDNFRGVRPGLKIDEFVRKLATEVELVMKINNNMSSSLEILKKMQEEKQPEKLAELEAELGNLQDNLTSLIMNYRDISETEASEEAKVWIKQLEKIYQGLDKEISPERRENVDISIIAVTQVTGYMFGKLNTFNRIDIMQDVRSWFEQDLGLKLDLDSLLDLGLLGSYATQFLYGIR